MRLPLNVLFPAALMLAPAAATRTAPVNLTPRADKLPDWLPSREGRDSLNPAH